MPRACGASVTNEREREKGSISGRDVVSEARERNLPQMQGREEGGKHIRKQSYDIMIVLPVCLCGRKRARARKTHEERKGETRAREQGERQSKVQRQPR